MKRNNNQIFRRDFLKGLVTLPFLGYFGFSFKENIEKGIDAKTKSSYKETLKIGQLDAPRKKLNPESGNSSNPIRFGLVGNGWRGEQLLHPLGYMHQSVVEKMMNKEQINRRLKGFLEQEEFYTEFVGVCDTFDIHAKRGTEFISRQSLRNGININSKPIKIYPSYRDMIASGEIDAIVIATADHTHAPIAIEAARAGIHVYLEKPMAHSIKDAIELRDTIKSTGVVFQLGHQNRQQMSFQIARELYQKGVIGDVTMVHTYTNRNNLFDAWIRDEAFDHNLGNIDNINWKEFLTHAPWQEFDKKRYFSWQRYSDYGTSVTGNDFSHTYDCVNQVLDLGIPESVVALGGQYFYKGHGDMPDVLSVVFQYPKRNLMLCYDCSLKNSVYRPSRILGTEATMDVDKSIIIQKDPHSLKFKDIDIDSEDPLYTYASGSDVDAVSSATSKGYIQRGYGKTFIDGKQMDATFLHVKEWIDAIRGARGNQLQRGKRFSGIGNRTFS